jgi:hypothetical protein
VRLATSASSVVMALAVGDEIDGAEQLSVASIKTRANHRKTWRDLRF